MQTFLPFADFYEATRVLDPSRLGNQVYREGMTILRGGWPNHIVSRMWRGYEQALAWYLIHGVEELDARGHCYFSRPWCRELHEFWDRNTNPEMPPWMGDEAIHSSHRGVLLYKNYDWYSQFGWAEKPRPPLPDGRMDYVWPVIKEKDDE